MDPVTLEGRYVRLEPLASSHRDGLCQAIRDGELWKLPVTFVPHPEEIDGFFADAERIVRESSGFVFATIHRQSGRVIGSTRYMHASPANRRIEIGFTFIAHSHQRTAINTEAKLLMLSHAFDSMNLNRVEFLTDVLNTTSRSAIVRLGATEEGILRSHIIMRGGRVRDSAVYSIVRDEWPSVLRRLEASLDSSNR
jgi:RimJ/RimL family protein N-acetyltransferase